jgi:hypothetical protein
MLAKPPRGRIFRADLAFFGRKLRHSMLHHRSPWLTFASGLVLLFLEAACPPPPQPPKKLEMEPIGTIKNIPTTAKDEGGDSGVTTPNSGTPSPGSSACNASEFENLEETLKQCEVPLPRASEVPSIKDKVEVKVAASPAKTTPGGRVEVLVTVRNKSSDTIPLYFTGDPVVRFEIEATDNKGRRVDLPTAKWPGYPKGHKPETREAKAAKITIEKGGTAKIKVQWDAVKTKWAPEQAKTWDGKGYPRIPSGPLGPGKYSVKVLLPWMGGEAVESPKAQVEVGGL